MGLKLLFLVTDDWYFLSHRLELARAARERGFEVVVATAPGARAGEIEREGFALRPVRFRRSVLGQVANLPLVERLTRLYRRERPDLVHHVSFLPLFYGTLAARRAGVPAVVNAVTGLGHAFAGSGPGGSGLRAALRRAYRLALAGEGRRTRVRTLFQNRDDLWLFVEAGLVDSGHAVHVPGSGVDVERFRPQPEPGPEDGPPVVLHASRMLWSKGVADTVAASRELARRGVAHRLVLAGRTHRANPGSIPEAELRAWTERGAARWIGAADDVPALLAASHVVCLPTYYREGVPKVLLEAAACARPIVTTDVPGCRDVVEHGVNGLAVPTRDPARLADALARLLGDAELRARMGRAGRERAVARFADAIVVRRTFDVYDALLSPALEPRARTA